MNDEQRRKILADVEAYCEAVRPGEELCYVEHRYNEEALTLAREWGPSGIRINAIGPGPFPVENSVEGLTRPAVLEHLQRTTPLGRLGRIEEVVGPILFFLSPLSGYTSGQVLVCDGGRRTLDWVIPPDLQPPDWR